MICDRSKPLSPVAVMAAAIMSNWSPARAVKLESKSVFTHWTCTPSRLAISSVSSTSKPTGVPFLTVSNGANSRQEATWRIPGFRVVNEGDGVPAALPAALGLPDVVVELLLQAAPINARTATVAMVRINRLRIVSLSLRGHPHEVGSPRIVPHPARAGSQFPGCHRRPLQSVREP